MTNLTPGPFAGPPSVPAATPEQKVVSKVPFNLAAGEEAEKNRWVRLVKITYTTPHSTLSTWEAAERTTRPADTIIDGVGILALLHSPDRLTPPRILLQKQFRPPLGLPTVELPAGLLDPSETPLQCAVRELLEETGYHGTPATGHSRTPFLMYNDPGFCNTNLHMIHLDVDLGDERNKNPKPMLQEGEYIECFAVGLGELWETCSRMEAEGYAIDARVGTLAEGLEVAKKWLR